MNLFHNQIKISIFFSLVCLAKTQPSFPLTGKSGFKDVWEARFMHRPVERLDDRRTLVEIWLLGGYEHNSAMLDVLLTDMIFSELDNDYIFRTEIPHGLFQNHARCLKGKELTEEEKGKVTKLFRKCAGRHPHGGALNYAFLPVYLHKTVGGSQKMPEALEKIARGDACPCDYGVSESPTAEQLVQLLDEGNAVILERKGVSSWNPFANDDGKWRLVFGSFTDDNGKLLFLMNVPEETTLMEKLVWNKTSDVLESIDLGTIYEYNKKRYKSTLYAPVRSIVDNYICNNGFMLLPENELSNYRLHAIRHWRRSLSPWDDELRDILGLAKPEKKAPMEKPLADAASSDLWRYYFAENRGSAGISFEGSCLWKLNLPVGRFSSLEQAMLASAAASRPDFVGFGLSFPGRLFHASRLFLGNSLLYPKQPELDQCIALTDKQLTQYKEKYGELPQESFHWDDPGHSNDYMERHHPDYKSRHSLSAHLFHSLPLILKGVSSVRDAVDKMGPACAWTATVEGGPGTDWETVKLALWRQIPVILEGKDGDWRTAFAYLVHDGKKLLLVTKKQDATTAPAPAEPVLKQYELPEELPPELEFMEYDETQWTPWFVHHFEPTVEHLAPQILEIFKNHPEAKAMMKKNTGK